MGCVGLGPWVGEAKPLGKPSPEATPVPTIPTYLPTSLANCQRLSTVVGFESFCSFSGFSYIATIFC